METLIRKTGEYIETRLELIRLKTVNKSSDVASTFVSYFILFSIVNLFVLMLSIGLALLIGNWMENNWLGFLVVALAYLLVGILILIFWRKGIKSFIQNIIVESLLK